MSLSFERIIGGTEEQQEEFLKRAERASVKSGEELFGEFLVAPTLEENEAIAKAAAFANSIAAEYGASRQFDGSRIFLLQPGGVEAVTKGRVREGVCDTFEQSIAVERSVSHALLAKSVVHEMYHMDSYQSSQMVEVDLPSGSTKIEGRPYRSGISMRGRDGEGNYFGLAQEAIIATLSKRFFDEVIAVDPQYKEELERTEKIKQWVLDFAEGHIVEGQKQAFAALINDVLLLPDNERIYNEIFASNEEDAYKFGYFRSYFERNMKSGDIIHERAEEREKFDEALDDIAAASERKTVDKNALFDAFARAHFSGNYLSLARIVEDALGEGSFRKLGIRLGEMNNV